MASPPPDTSAATCYAPVEMRPKIRQWPRAGAWLGLVTVLGAAVAGCGPSRNPNMTYHASGLPLWQGTAADLFDDNIDPAAVGLSMEGPSPRSDRFLRARAQTADVVARVRVNTVTVDSVGDDTTYHLGVQVGVPTLTKPRIEDRSFELVIRPGGRSYGVAKAFDARLRGMTFVGFIGRFATADGEPEIHWHLSADTAEVAAAVKEAVALGEVSGN